MLSITFSYCYAECHYAECLYDECHYAECHYAECHYPECHYADFHYVECHYAECHYAECHYAECHYAECHGAPQISNELFSVPGFNQRAYLFQMSMKKIEYLIVKEFVNFNVELFRDSDEI